MGHGYITLGLHLAPSTLSGVMDTCPHASAACRIACLNTAGRGGMMKQGESTNMIQKARIRKTELFYNDRDLFLSMLIDDITKGIKQAHKHGLIPCVRLNLTSDILFEKTGIMQHFNNVQFYDYTKIIKRSVPDNYHLTFSRSESNALHVEMALRRGQNIAVVYDRLPESDYGRRVIDGDKTDLRFLDERGVIVGLKAKGGAKKDFSGFVVRMRE